MVNKKETKRERFIRVAELRSQNVLDALQKLSRCARSDIYEYSEEEVQKIFATIEAKVQDVRDAYSGRKRFSLSEK